MQIHPEIQKARYSYFVSALASAASFYIVFVSYFICFIVLSYFKLKKKNFIKLGVKAI